MERKKMKKNPLKLMVIVKDIENHVQTLLYLTLRKEKFDVAIILVFSQLFSYQCTVNF